MLLSELFENVTQAQLNDVEKFADKLWAKLGVDIAFTKHFVERMNDDRNNKDISSAELIRLFKKEYERWGKDIKTIDDEGEAVLTDLFTTINLPFVMKDTADGKKLVAKTVMRKTNFKTPDPSYKVS